MGAQGCIRRCVCSTSAANGEGYRKERLSWTACVGPTRFVPCSPRPLGLRAGPGRASAIDVSHRAAPRTALRDPPSRCPAACPSSGIKECQIASCKGKQAVARVRRARPPPHAPHALHAWSVTRRALGRRLVSAPVTHHEPRSKGDAKNRPNRPASFRRIYHSQRIPHASQRISAQPRDHGVLRCADALDHRGPKR